MWRAISAGWLRLAWRDVRRASGTDSSPADQPSAAKPSRPTDVRVRQASAPQISTVSASPAAMSRHARLTRAWGSLPPIGESASSRGPAPRRDATARAALR